MGGQLTPQPSLWQGGRLWEPYFWGRGGCLGWSLSCQLAGVRGGTEGSVGRSRQASRASDEPGPLGGLSCPLPGRGEHLVVFQGQGGVWVVGSGLEPRGTVDEA